MRDDEKRKYEDPADGILSEPEASERTYSRYPPPVPESALKLALAALIVAAAAAAVAILVLVIELT